jgi:hypothetical protein
MDTNLEVQEFDLKLKDDLMCGIKSDTHDLDKNIPIMPEKGENKNG